MNYRIEKLPDGFVGQVWHGGWLNGLWIAVTLPKATCEEAVKDVDEHRKMTAGRR